MIDLEQVKQMEWIEAPQEPFPLFEWVPVPGHPDRYEATCDGLDMVIIANGYHSIVTIKCNDVRLFTHVAHYIECQSLAAEFVAEWGKHDAAARARILRQVRRDWAALCAGSRKTVLV